MEEEESFYSLPALPWFGQWLYLSATAAHVGKSRPSLVSLFHGLW